MENSENNIPVEIGAFFDDKASTYDDHQKANITQFGNRHMIVAGAIEETSRELRILDLGCGTGIELEMLLARAPNARITCIDISGGMLEELKRKYADSLEQLEVIQGSFLDMPFREGHYEYVVSVLAMHHFIYPQKLNLYQRVRKALLSEGMYIEGDYYLPPEEEGQHLEHYQQLLETGAISPDTGYHIDIPFSVTRQRQVLLEAGFSKVEVLYEGTNAAVFSAC
ncbi:MAG TPA: methyltransferase domain-containing protein [Dehalococcoidia bacterium]|nr:methyltransferase domain-containing protein [Dehalococcoidia bacterium]